MLQIRNPRPGKRKPHSQLTPEPKNRIHSPTRPNPLNRQISPPRKLPTHQPPNQPTVNIRLPNMHPAHPQQDHPPPPPSTTPVHTRYRRFTPSIQGVNQQQWV